MGRRVKNFHYTHDLEASLGYIRQGRQRQGFRETRVLTSFPTFNCSIYTAL